VSNIANVVGAVIGFAAIRQILGTQPTAVTSTPSKPLIKTGFVTGPAAGNQNFDLIKPAMQITPTQLQAFKPQTPEQAALTRERVTAPSGTPEQAALVSQAYTQGKVIPLGFRQGETTDDLLRRLFRN
tara:strand:+ start:809 stop:1192 length:384 start_codon:yes stop_codon:yes gene_type:complete